MLVQFMLKNVLSFKDETILDMSAVNAYKEHPYNLIDLGIKEKFLHVAAIYGANASGKSNLSFAMALFQNIITESMNNPDKDGVTALKKYYNPFCFEEKLQNSEFQIIEILGDYEYKYGFEYNSKRIICEWLYRKNLRTNRTSIILERTESSVFLGALVKKECEIYKEQILPETLALSFFCRLRLKTSLFQELYEGIIKDRLVVDADFYENFEVMDNFLPKEIDDNKDMLLEFLSAIDTGIKDVGYETEDGKNIFWTMHIGKDGNNYKMSLFSESEGTLKGIITFIYALAAIETDRSLFVDELNAKLHPLLLKFIIDLFYSKNSKAQLIYTTHDTTLMDKKFFRRDQIWFVQKDEYGYSQLSSLAEFKVRSDASFEKDYLSGVYGGIPRIKDFSLKEGE